MCCFTWLLASRPFRRCRPASGTSTPSSRRSRRRHRSSLEDMVRASSLSAVGPLLQAADLPVQPLTEREVIVLVQSWKSIQKQFIETGVSMFLRMFESSPAVRETFEKFREMDDDQTASWAPRGRLASSAVLQIHGMVVMNAIDEIISSLDENSEVVELILEQGRSHARFGDNLTADSFWAIEQPFLTAVREVLGHRYTAYLDRLYRQVIRFILSLLVVGFKQTFNDTNRRPESSTSSISALEFTSNSDIRRRSNATDNASRPNSRRNVNNNCWTDDKPRSRTESNDAAVKSEQTINKTDIGLTPPFAGSEQLLPGQIIEP